MKAEAAAEVKDERPAVKKAPQMPIKAGGKPITVTSRFELEKEIERELGLALDALMQDESNAPIDAVDTPNHLS